MDDTIQLDLTATIEDVPQANSLPLFISMLEAVVRGTSEFEPLRRYLRVEERTLHYYLDFGRWLKFVRPTSADGVVHLTETGQAFVDSQPARGRLFSSAIFARKLVQVANALKRESANKDDVETLGTREACLKAITGMSDLSESTAERRASGLAQMLEAAYKPSQIDWSTGEQREDAKRSRIEFTGRSFLTALAARQFGPEREFRIGFPYQVRAFVESKGHGMSAKHWDRASYESADRKSTWFGSVPVNTHTIDVAERGGRDLRRLLVLTSPYVALGMALLTYRDPVGRPCITMTHDMYGLRMWEHDRELGEVLIVLERLAEDLGLLPIKGLPSELAHEPEPLVEPASAADLVEVLKGAGFIKVEDTTYSVARGIDHELGEASGDVSSVLDHFEPLHAIIRQQLREQPE